VQARRGRDSSLALALSWFHGRQQTGSAFATTSAMRSRYLLHWPAKHLVACRVSRSGQQNGNSARERASSWDQELRRSG